MLGSDFLHKNVVITDRRLKQSFHYTLFSNLSIVDNLLSVFHTIQWTHQLSEHLYAVHPIMIIQYAWKSITKDYVVVSSIFNLSKLFVFSLNLNTVSQFICRYSLAGDLAIEQLVFLKKPNDFRADVTTPEPVPILAMEYKRNIQVVDLLYSKGRFLVMNCLSTSR